MLRSTSFIGREKEFVEIKRLLAEPDCRLLTLAGPGGTGKTRLARQLEADLKQTTDIVFVPLQSVRSPDLFLQAIADALNMAFGSAEDSVLQLGRYLDDKKMLIILDNFEHLLAASEQLAALLAAAPRLTFLVTSRETLNLQEEWHYALGGLAFPTDEATPDGQSLFDAVQLFCDRARRAYPEFSPTEEADDIIQICRLVDGLPLALELAAAWRRSLTCRAIASEIQTDLDFLSTRMRNLPERHRSIQAVFDQTWQKLSVAEQNIYKRLSVFQGGFKREAAAAVSGAPLTTLLSLVDKSLLRVDVNGRYYLHELLRQFAAEKLASTVAEFHQVQADHAAYFVAFLHQRNNAMVGAGQIEAIADIKSELDNIRIAWDWLVDEVKAVDFQKVAMPFAYYFQYQGSYLEGSRHFNKAAVALQPMEEQQDAALALLRILVCRAWYNLRFGDLEAVLVDADHCLAIYDRLQRDPLPGYFSDPNGLKAFAALIRGDFEQALRTAEQACLVAEAQAHVINHQFAAHIMADAYLGQGAYEIALQYAQKAYGFTQESGDRWYMAYVLNTLGQTAAILGQNSVAKAHFASSYDIREAFDDPEGMALASTNLGNLAFEGKAYDEAGIYFEQSRVIYEKINDKGGLAAACKGLGVVALAQNDGVTAQKQFSRVLALCLEIDFRPLLLTLLVHIAELLWQRGQKEQPIALLALTAKHAATEHETRKIATEKLAIYKLSISAKQFKQQMAVGHAAQLDVVGHKLVYELSLAYSPLSIGVSTDQLAEATGNQALVEPLTPREMDVLQLIVAGNSNPEIAEQLILSVGTIKFHTNKIFGKLSVRNRVEAVTRARQLKLV